MSAAGALRSTGITPRPHYYSPVRHPLVSPPISRGLRLYDGSSSRAFRPGTRRASPVARCVLCLRAAGSTPPMEPDASASVRQSLLPSPPTVGLGPRHLRFSRHPRRSLALRPGHSLAIPWMTWSIGFSSVGFPSGCYPSYGALALTPVGLTPTEHTCLIWTHVGSRAGAVLRRDGLAVDSPFPLGVPHEPPREPGSCPRHLKRSVRISRTPLSCRLHRTGYVTYRDGTAARSTQRHVCRRDAPRGSDSAFPEQYSRRRSVLQTTKRHYQPLLPPPSLTTTCRQQGPFARRALPRVHTTTAPSATRSSPRRFPGGSGYTTGLPPGPFALGRDGLLQLLGVSYVSVLPVAPRRWSLTRQPVCVSPCCLRPRRSGSALGTCGSRGTLAVRLRCGPDTRSPSLG